MRVKMKFANKLKPAICLLTGCLCLTVLLNISSDLRPLPLRPATGSGMERTSHMERMNAGTSSFKVYLSPSCQTWNPYSDGSGSEEYHMRQIAEAMPKYLQQYGIDSVLAAPQSGNRQNQKKTITERVKQAVDTKCNLYLSIHSNARDGGPKTNGTLILYPSTNDSSRRFAITLANNFIYPDKSAIDFGTNDALWEMYMPPMPHCLIETAYHDNSADISWIENNTENIAQNLAYCVALYAGKAE
jgi:N-acetylmuramoyl-L-alanine amidase